MSKILLQGKVFYYNKKAYHIEDMMDAEFYNYSNTLADDYKVEIYTVNELFFTFIQQTLALEKFIKDNHISEISIKFSDFSTTCIALSAAMKANISVNYNSFIFKLCQYIVYLKEIFYIFASTGYIALKTLPIKYISSPDSSADIFSILRLNQEYQKLGFLMKNDNILFEFENLKSTLSKNKNISTNVYNRFSRFEKLIWIAKAFFNGIRDLKDIRVFIQTKINKYCAFAACEYHSKRVVHTAFYAQMINRYFSFFKGKIYITGKIIDRYAVIDSVYAKKYNIKIYNFPHGVEYGFKLPYGLVGNVFFATSKIAADHFNILYNTNKFEYNEKIAKHMFNRNYKGTKKTEIIFFSEAHEPNVNIEIINGLKKILNPYNIDIIVKPHPRENLKFYNNISNLKIITDFDYAITGNICIARRSTVLIEALYNNSDANAIIINANDYAIYKNYPSLQDKDINVFFSIGELADYIIKSLEDSYAE